ncbi:MAG: RNA polymerase sigma factor [Mangrovibacterium sp.]|nr:RNA polymerase sigma factor [Mangrovibacterium sp.]
MTAEEYNDAVNQYSDSIYRFILKNIRDVEKARDIVQDSYEKLWIHHRQVAADAVKSYLYATAYHRLIDVIRKDSRIRLGERHPTTGNMHTDQYTDLAEVLHQIIVLLPNDQRSVLMLRDYEGYSYREIAEITMLSEAQVKVYIYRARVFMKNYIRSMDILI